MSNEPAFFELLDLLGNEQVLEILAVADTYDPVSAKQLDQHCDTSLPSIYRHLERLVDYKLLTEETQIDSDGNHYSVYTNNFAEAQINLDGGEFQLELTRQDEASEGMLRVWHSLRNDDN